MFRFIINEKYFQLFLLLRRPDVTIKQITQKTNFTLNWTRQILIRMENAKLINPVFNNKSTEKVYKINLTRKGFTLLSGLQDIQKLAREVK